MPTGKVKWYDVDKGFGFVSSDDGADVFLHASVLPEGMTSVKPGTRLEYGVVQGRRGNQALSVRLLDPVPSLTRGQRKPPEDMSVIVEYLIKLLDSTSNTLRRGRYPDKPQAGKIASVLRAVADDLDA